MWWSKPTIPEFSYEVARRTRAEMSASLAAHDSIRPGSRTSEIYPQPGARATWRNNGPSGYVLISLFDTTDPCVSRIEVKGFPYSQKEEI